MAENAGEDPARRSVEEHSQVQDAEKYRPTAGEEQEPCAVAHSEREVVMAQVVSTCEPSRDCELRATIGWCLRRVEYGRERTSMMLKNRMRENTTE